ncbi:MAG: hypothetical protein O2910_08565 [Proteobacteria bacterium]|nr:hypothetical protein [Pseudomonadota bacterium]
MRTSFFALIAFMGATLVFATAEARRHITYLEKFDLTGEMVDCIMPRRIKESIILDNSTVIFRLSGNKYYLNRLTQRCGGLRMQNGFTFNTHGAPELCKFDTITGTHPCLLGAFERIEKKPKE